MGNKQQFSIEFLPQACHINEMNFNQLKRKLFFWTEKLQISRVERISITLLLALIVTLLVIGTLLTQKVNQNQEKYNRLAAELERKTLQVQQEKEELNQKYTARAIVETQASEGVTDSEYNEEEKEKDKETKKKAAAQPKIININEATVTELQQLDGIGPTYAQRILKYREENEGFKSVDELTNIKGIGKKRLENIRAFVTLE